MRGSPPYTWGALQGLAASSASIRITPIYMGSTRTLSPACRSLQDHPHIHGEHTVQHYGVDWSKGSPPYTWGALSECLNWERNPRITPIYMGSTQRASRRGERVWDHPHIHGEHSFVFDQATVSSGSPPYTWGARRRSYQDHCQSRITPIYMGSTICDVA